MSEVSKLQKRAAADPALALFWAPMALATLVAVVTWVPEWFFDRTPVIPGYVGLVISLLSALLCVIWQVSSDVAVLNQTVKIDLDEKDKQVVSLTAQTNDLAARLQSAILNKDIRLQVSIANFNNFLPYIPLYVAADCHFFEEEGLDVIIRPHNDDLDAIQSIADRRNLFAISDPMFVFDQSVRAAPLRIVAPFINKVAVWALSKTDLTAALDESTSVADRHIAHKVRIVTFDQETTAHRLAAKLQGELQNAGVTPKGSAIVTLARGPREEMTAFFRKHFISDLRQLEDADILVFSEPEITYLQSRLSAFRHRIGLHDLLYEGQQFAFTSVIALDRTVNLEPEVARRFLRAIRHAQLFVYSLPPLPATNVHGFIESDLRWSRTVAAVRTQILKCYPSDMVMRPNDVAKMIDNLRHQSYFSSNLTFREKWRDGLVNAYQLASGGDPADLDGRTTDVAEVLKLVSF